MNKAKLIMIGLDGGTFKIIDPLLKDGQLPNFQRLINEGVRATLKSTIPPLTAPAWVTLMTGVNPGKHGFFDFKKLNKIGYNLPFNQNPEDTYTLMHSRYYAGKTMWDIFSKMDLKVSVLTMPMTYPAWKINGYMLAGYPTPNFKNLNGFPEEWAATIGPLFDTALFFMSKNNDNDNDKLIEACRAFVNKLTDILIKQIENDECDVYSVVFSSTDFLQHRFFKCFTNPENKFSKAIPKIYIEVDKCIGRILNLIGSEHYNFIILSDHGFTFNPEKYFHINAWLVKEGYLVAKTKKNVSKTYDSLLNILRFQKVGLRKMLKKYFKYFPASMQKRLLASYHATESFSWLETKAFRYKMGLAEGIVINLKDRYSSGMVEKSEYESLRTEIINKLKGLRDEETGVQVVNEVYRKEEVYDGKFIDFAPDIIFMLNYQYKGGVGIDKTTVINHIMNKPMEAEGGTHDRDGILVMSGPKFKKDCNISSVQIVDVFPTILCLLGISIPSYTDGKIIKEAFLDDPGSPQIVHKDIVFHREGKQVELSMNEQEEIKKALKGLGYLD